MQCRQCGTEIADKALICFRCGAATAEPPVSSGHRAAGGSFVPPMLALVALLLAALFMGRAMTGEAPRMVAWVVAALAALAILWHRLVRR